MSKVCLISLGCDKNLVDSEMVLGILAESEKQYEFTDDEEAADVIIVNTCCFILDAKQESIDTLIRVSAYKHGGNLKKLIVIGCLAERYKDEIKAEIPEVDEVIGIPELEKYICEHLPKHRINSTGGWYGYLKIADGCDKRCTYCIIPKLRGNYHSYPMEELIREAEDMAEAGVRELILVAQETTVYGIDIYGKKMLPELLHKLCKIDGLKWIRLMYAYPEEINDELIECMASEEKIVHYIDMPVQHASDRILKLMGRRTTRKDIEDTIARLRDAMPDICIRTSIISGFPGETEEDHDELLDFVDRTEFNKLGDFTYSKEEGTAAAKLKGQIPAKIKKQRREDVMSLQQNISNEILQNVTGTIMDVIIEGYLQGDNVCVGRTYMDAPEVDGYIFIDAKKRHDSGEIIKVNVTGSSEYDLIGEEI